MNNLKQKYYGVEIQIVNVISIHQVRYKHKYNKYSLKKSVYSILLIFLIGFNVIQLLFLAYKI